MGPVTQAGKTSVWVHLEQEDLFLSAPSGALPGFQPWSKEQSHLIAEEQGRGDPLLSHTTSFSDPKPARPPKSKPGICPDHISTSFPKILALSFSTSISLPLSPLLHLFLSHCSTRTERKRSPQLSRCFNTTPLFQTPTSPLKSKQ